MIGVGGWAYLPGRHQNKLGVCSKLYDFVEVNSTFYKLPPLELAMKWRLSVSDQFEFSVRANRKLTHERHLEPTEENYSEYRKNIAICDALRAGVLHFQFPPSFEVTRNVITGWRNFFSSVGRKSGVHPAIEVRHNDFAHSPLLHSFFRDFDIIPVNDPSRNEIDFSSVSGIQYSRVFGRGEHTIWSFSTSELEELKDKVMSTSSVRKYVTFHNITMYEDAARMREIVRPGGSEPHLSISAIDSLKEALVAERIVYPVTRSELSARLGWRVLVANETQRVHCDELIDKAQDTQEFDSMPQVLDICRPLVEQFLTGQ